MIFGLPEQENEEVNSLVIKVFRTIVEKPRIEACRVGKQAAGRKVRPVKVTAACSTIVDQILARSKSLRKSEKFSTVFVSPDRSLEQRHKQRELVAKMQKLFTEQPGKVHFIRDSTIVSVDKTDKTSG
jgi:hypothetical protein